DPEERFATCELFAVQMGCQFLSAETAPSEVLHKTVIKKVYRDRRTRRDRGLFRTSGALLALTQEELWASVGTDILRWPLAAIKKIERAGAFGNKIHLYFSEGSHNYCEIVTFYSRWERDQWHGHLKAVIAERSQERTREPPRQLRTGGRK